MNKGTLAPCSLRVAILVLHKEYRRRVEQSMDAKEISMFRFLDGADKKFVIPVYQRAYSWKRENCESLLKDLMSVYEHNYVSHFFGSIVYVMNTL